MANLSLNPWNDPSAAKPLWPGGATASVCRPCKLFLGWEPLCPQCGKQTTETVVFNTPEIPDADEPRGLGKGPRRRPDGRLSINH